VTAATAGATVQCRGVVHVYRALGVDVAALRGVDLDVAAGESVAMFGPSGSGKSTLLAVLAGIRRPSAGEVALDGRDIARAPQHVLRRLRQDTVAVLLQDPAANLLPYLDAVHNVAWASRAPSTMARRDAVALLERVGVHGADAHRPVARLPRGRQHSVALAVAFANRPRLLLADEPTSRLPGPEAEALVDAMVMLAGQGGTTLVVVTHDAAVAARLDRTLYLREGRVEGEATGSRERLSVIAADGSVQLPESLSSTWPPGTRVRFREDAHGLHVERE
jgi:putative ABC transport system ATP-binding protein